MGTEEALRIHMRLQESRHYLRIPEPIDGRLYLIHGRHSHFGIWSSTTNAFTIRRRKFGRHHAAREFHWDGEAFPTAKPFLQLPHQVPGDDLLGFLERMEAEIPFEESLTLMLEASRQIGQSRGQLPPP